MGSGEESLGSFFFYICVVYPVTSYFLKPGRFSRAQGLSYAIGFLCLLAAIKTGHEVWERGPNYYQRLGISRNSSPLDIKKAYKRMSLELHPDKNKAANAAEEFARLKDGYDVLMDPQNREVYNKFGADGVKQNRRMDESQMLLEIAVYYATWGMLAYMLTLGKQSSNARSWIYTGQIVMLIAEVSLMLQDTKLPDWFFPTNTEHELVLLMHSLFPAYLNGCRVLGGFLYVDVEEQLRQSMRELHEQNKDILLVLRDIQVNMQSMQVGGPKGAGAGGPVAPIKATPTGKLKELEGRLQLSRQGPGARVSEAMLNKAATEKSGGNYGIWVMMALYVVSHFVFNQ